MSVYDTLSKAIQSKKPCEIAKPGQPSRSICPYRLGTSAHGVMNLGYYQYGGFTTTAGGLQPDGSSANWRCNHVADIATATIIDGPWHEPTVKPKTTGKCVVNVDFEVAY